MHKRGLCRRAVSVRLSVWISVIFVHSVETNKHVLKSFSLSGSHIIHVFPYQTLWQYSDDEHLMGTSNAGGVDNSTVRAKCRNDAFCRAFAKTPRGAMHKRGLCRRAVSKRINVSSKFFQDRVATLF